MYRDLRTNAPAQVMEYPDFPWHYSRSYPDSEEVLAYIHDYSKAFNLEQYISFEHYIKKVTRWGDCWRLTVLNVRAKCTFVRDFDVLILCPGRSCIPLWPNISTLNQFKGKLIHVHDYRNRHPFRGEKVAVLGAGPSGFDMAMQVSTVAERIIFINRTVIQFGNLPENILQIKGEIAECGPHSIKVRKVDGGIEELEIDSLIVCTGYGIHLGFLDLEQCGLRLNEDDTLDGVYRHLVNIKYPTMALLSIIRPSINFPLYHQQV